MDVHVRMYAMVDRASNAVANVNQAYMAALMTSPCPSSSCS